MKMRAPPSTRRAAFSLSGGFLLCSAPRGGVFEGNVPARADRYFARPALVSFELEVHRLRDAMCRAEIFDRIPRGWHWRPADRRRLRLVRRFQFALGSRLNRLRVRARRFGLLLRLIVRLCLLFGIGRRFGGTR